jgi:hypothetical protein
MIDIPDTTVLRYTAEEAYQIRSYYEDEIEPGIDWFSAHVQREYPEKSIITVFTDVASNCVYVVLATRYPMIMSKIVADDDGTLREIEYLDDQW